MPSALELIHSCAELLGRYDRRTTTSVGTASSLVIAAYANSVLSASELANAAVLIEDGCCAGEQGMLTNSPLTRSTGTLNTGDDFTNPIASGVTASFYSADRLPALRRGDRPGLMEIANQALPRTWAEDTITIAGVTDLKHYPMTHSWLSDDTRIIDIQYPVTNSDDVPRIVPRSSWSWVSDGETRSLRFPGAPFKTGESFTIKVNRPGNSRLKLNATAGATLTAGAVTALTVLTGGAYTVAPTVTISGGGGSGATGTAVLTNGTVTSITITAAGSLYTTTPTVTLAAGIWTDQTSQTAGLVSLSDECIPDVRFVRPMMLALAFGALAEMGAPGQTVAEWMAKAEKWERRAVSLKAKRLPRDADEGVVRLRIGAIAGSRQRATGWNG